MIWVLIVVFVVSVAHVAWFGLRERELRGLRRTTAEQKQSITDLQKHVTGLLAELVTSVRHKGLAEGQAVVARREAEDLLERLKIKSNDLALADEIKQSLMNRIDQLNAEMGKAKIAVQEHQAAQDAWNAQAHDAFAAAQAEIAVWKEKAAAAGRELEKLKQDNLSKRFWKNRGR